MEGSDDTSHPPLQEPSTGPPTTYAELQQPESAMAVPMNQDVTSTSLAVKVEQGIGGNRQRSTPLILNEAGGQENLTQGMKRDHDSMENRGGSLIRKHDPASEKLPETATNHHSFRLAEVIAASIPEEIISIIERSEYEDEDLDFLKEEADRVTKIYTAGEMRIGLKGKSGTGKSSLINCLLGYDGIAPSGAQGDACTAVVQEFRKPRPSQRTPFEAEITFLQPQARETALKDWVTDFWDTYKPGVDEDEEDESMGVNCDQEVQNGESSTTAVDAIHSLFLDHPECSNPEETKAFLSSATSRGDPNLLTQLRAWTDTLLKSLNVESGKATIREPEPQDLRNALAPFLAKVRGQPSPWPLVKLVRCYFDSPVLSQDIVLADLPGTSDVNKTRTQATKMYMADVHHVGVVDRIERAGTDADTHRSLIEAYKRKRGAHVFMAVTFSDPNTPDIAELIDASINTPGASAVAIKELSMLKEELENMEFKLQNVDAQQKEALSNREYTLFENLGKGKEDLEGYKTFSETFTNASNTARAQKAAKLDQTIAMCVQIRKTRVRKTIVGRFFNTTKQETLPVFCVSNYEYLAHIKDRKNSRYRPKMSVEDTEIPNLRAYIYSLPAARKLAALKHHIKYVLPSLTNSFGMTCSQSKVKRKAELAKILSEAQDPIPKEVSQVFQDLLDSDILAKFGKLRYMKTKAGYISAANERLDEYAEWASGTQKVFCRHSGQWSTPKVGTHDWNAAMMEPMVEELRSDLQAWEDISDVLYRNLSEKITGTLQSLISKLEDSSGPSRGVLEPFFAELRLQVDIVDGLCRSEAEKMERGLCKIKQSMTSSEDVRSCYFVQALQKTYDECVAMKGAGVGKRRMAKLAARISQKSAANPFHKVHEKAKAAAQELIKKHTQEFTDKILETFGKLHAMFLRSFRTDENDTPEAKALRNQLRRRLPDFQSKIAECGRLIQESCESENKHNI